MRKALKRHGSPAAIVTDGLKSYRAAMRDLGAIDKQEICRQASNRVESSHLPMRRRERAMLRFRRMKSLQKFVSVHINLHNYFASERHLIDRQTRCITSLSLGMCAVWAKFSTTSLQWRQVKCAALNSLFFSSPS